MLADGSSDDLVPAVLGLLALGATGTLGVLLARDFRGWAGRVSDAGGADPARVRIGGVGVLAISLVWGATIVLSLLH